MTSHLLNLHLLVVTFLLLVHNAKVALASSSRINPTTTTTIVSTCGDLIVQPNEECDAGLGNGMDGFGCRADCTLPVCGDGHRAPGEYCDDDSDDCTDKCVTKHIFPVIKDAKGDKYKVAAPNADTIFGDPMITLQKSDHFVIRASFDDQDLLQEQLNDTLSEKSQKENLQVFETIWKKFIKKFKFAPPYFYTDDKYKVNVVVTDYGYLSGGTFQEGPPWPEGPQAQVQMVYHAFDGYGGMLHEFSHALQNMPPRADWFEYGGWFSESHAEFMTYRAHTTGVGCSEVLVNAPHLYYGTTRNRYCNWQFWDYLADKFGMKPINSLWTGTMGGHTSLLFPYYPDPPCVEMEGPFAVLQREMGWSIEVLNDLFGMWAMSNVIWDYEQKGDVYREAYGSYSDDLGVGQRGRVVRLDSSKDTNGETYYFPPDVLAPQRWGYNLVPLILDDDGSNEIIIEFRGVVQRTSARTKKFGDFNDEPENIPEPNSGWRWGIVAIQENETKARYSPLQAGARSSLKFPTKSTDKEYYLMVMGAPTSLVEMIWDQMWYTIYRYPWRVKITGAKPLGHEPYTFPQDVSGDAHPNGGGFVQDSATVDETAYVGPRARVLEDATVKDGARIEDSAIVRGSAKVSGSAIVRGHALVDGQAEIRDDALIYDAVQINGGQVYDNAKVGGITHVCCDTKIYGSAEVVSSSVERPLRGDAKIHGTAKVLGDVEYSVEDLSSGVWYGFVHPEWMGDPKWGADRTEPEEEVTATFDALGWDDDDADCRYAHVGCPKSNEACILVGDLYECVVGAKAPKSYEKSHSDAVRNCIFAGDNGDPTCLDNNDYRYQNNPEKGCDWIAAKESRRLSKCREVEEVQKSCATTCGYCCRDDETFTLKKSSMTCAWIAKKSNRRKKFCKKNKVKVGCRETCKACFDSIRRMS